MNNKTDVNGKAPTVVIKGKNRTDSEAHAGPEDVVKNIPGDEGEARVEDVSSVETVPAAYLEQIEEVAELEKFMRDPVEIMVYEPIEEGHEKIIQLAVNGKNQFVIRGQNQTVARCYVEVLARARKVTVSSRGYKSPNGDAKNIVNFNSGLQYPFQVMNDPNPNGPRWLANIFSEK